jgi:hypothetical protein
MKRGKVFQHKKMIFLPHVVFSKFNEDERAPLFGLPSFYRFDKDFELYDLKKIANSFTLLAQNNISKITLKDLLRAGGNDRTLNIEISNITSRIFQEETEDFMHLYTPHLKEAVVGKATISGKELLRYVFKTNANCVLVDGRIWLEDKMILFIQWKLRDTQGNDILHWVEDLKTAFGADYDSSYQLIFLHVTTALVPEKVKQEIKASGDNILYVDKTNLEEYCPINLLPYLMTPM